MERERERGSEREWVKREEVARGDGKRSSLVEADLQEGEQVCDKRAEEEVGEGGGGREGRGWFNPSRNFLIPRLQSGSLWDQYREDWA